MQSQMDRSKTKNLFSIVKALDEQKGKYTTIASIFNDELSLRKKLIIDLEHIVFDDFESLGKKAREILWRKVYYDPICISKRLFKQQPNYDTAELVNFIKDAVRHYKTLILRYEDIFSLNIRYTIDFAIIANGAGAFEKKTKKEIYTVNEINHALATIHSFLVSLGDLHRYCIEFNFCESDISPFKARELAEKYYVESFKLDPKIGAHSHNQLGTLKSGENYELDSIFHYLYSLCSPVPFELSDANVVRIFQQNSEILENTQSLVDCFSIKNFTQQIILVVDIFFYDKEIEDFNVLCRALLANFKEYLRCNRRSKQNDITFQVTGIFMLCLLKLKLNNSPKVYSLNAFLVAFCAEIISWAIERAEEFIEIHADENMKFCEEYVKKFNDFDSKIKLAKENSSRKEGFKFNNSESEQNGNVAHSLKNGQTLSSEEASGKSDSAKNFVTEAKSHKNMHLSGHNRRRRRRRASKSIEGSDYSESEAENYELGDIDSMNSDFDSCDEDEFSDRYSSSDDDDFDDAGPKSYASDSSDVVIENEEIVYANEESENGQKTATEDVIIEEEKIVFPPDTHVIEKPSKMKYKKKYTKVSPNVIIGFAEENVGCMKSLKILFDWLRVSNDILVTVHRSNPEFINQIMKLINILNIDIFTRKIYFERNMISTKNVREALRSLFDTRHQIATQEDVIFKKCILFEELQQPLEWELNCKLQISNEEDVILRNFKLIDFGFYICKIKKLRYSFCARTRFFIEKAGNRRRKCEKKRKTNEEPKKSRRRDRRRERRQKHSSDGMKENTLKSSQHQEVEDQYPSVEQAHKRNFRKGYLKNKVNENSESTGNDSKSMERKNELMSKLWLKSEIQSLESKKTSTSFTPIYIMLDSKCLTDFLCYVKNLVKSKKFVVLIPKAVLSDLDELKKSSEGAREAIKFLETEFKKGNRFMRIQRDPENMILPLLKIPTKLDHETTIFMKIVQFANFMVSNNGSEEGGDLPVLTLLTGDNLDDRKTTSSVVNQVAILESIPVKYEQIVRFSLKCKK